MQDEAFAVRATSELPEGSLVVRSGRVVLMMVDGRTSPVSAWDVFQATARSATHVGGVRLVRSPFESCPGTRFHVAPVEVAGRVTVGDDATLSVRRVALAGDDVVAVEYPDDHVLVGANWYPLDPDANAAVKAWLAESAPAGSIAPAEYPRLYRGDRPFRVLDEVPDDALVDLLPEIEVPDALHAELYPYQYSGFRWLAARSTIGQGGILADEMGLGKTMQAIALLLTRAAAGRPSLVVAPLTIIENWRREVARFAPTLRVYIHLGAARARDPSAIRSVDVVLTSYETAANDSGMLALVPWDLMIVDEAQAIRNPDARRSTMLRRIPRNSAVAMTGTPIENYAIDLWSIADFVSPGYLGDRSAFEASLEGDPRRLHAASRPLVLRRLVRDVAVDLPARIDIDVALEMFDPEAEAYDALRTQLLAGRGAAGPLVAIGKLRLFTAHPRLTQLDLGRPLEGIPSAKFARLLELLEEIFEVGDKVLVFAAFRRAIDLIVASGHARFGVPTFSLDGRTQPNRRQPLVDEFSAVPGAALLVLNPAAAGVGLNIPAANHVIHYTLEWNPAKENQATARAWRLGQERPVTVHRLFYADSIDEVMLDSMRRKVDLAEAAVRPRDAEESEIREMLRLALQRSPRHAPIRQRAPQQSTEVGR
jgi:SNF2 family DNA or RNA helicase